MKFQEIVELTREIAVEESEEVLAAWLYYLKWSALAREAISREAPPSEEATSRLREFSALAKEIVDYQDETFLKRTILEINEEDPTLGKRLLEFLESYRELSALLTEHGYKRKR